MATMTVFATTAIDGNVLGALTKWTIRPMPGVFVGTMSDRVRTELWRSLSDHVLQSDGYATLIHPAAGEQGYQVHTVGRNSRRPVDFDGLTLIAWPFSDGQEEKTITVTLPL